jgi:hypothetical protein
MTGASISDEATQIANARNTVIERPHILWANSATVVPNPIRFNFG